MTHTRFLKSAAVITAFTAIIFAGMISSSKRVRAGDDESSGQTEESRIRRGFAIAPVPLNLHEKNRALVGLGSYIVNAVGDCNGCHSAGPPSEFANGGNPYLLSPPFTGNKQLNLATYLGGGRDFGPNGSVQHLYSRNLTPDKTGLPAGGHTYKEFVEIMRRGTDFDHVHPNCTDGIATGNCYLSPVNGDLLQVMRWPFFQNMTDHDLRAIYEYLSAIPCNPGQVIAGAPYLQNACE
jgi:mono/diheme cytochrome c family protein